MENKWNWCIKMAVIVCLIGMVVIAKRLTSLNQQVSNVQIKMDAIEEQLKQNSGQRVYDSAAAEFLDFMQQETAQHREFIESQREFLIWLISGCMTAVIAVIGFLGLSNIKEAKQDVKNTYELVVKEKVEEKISEMLEGQENLKFLNTAVVNERRASERKIFFIFQDADIDKETYKMLHRTHTKVNSFHTNLNSIKINLNQEIQKIEDHRSNWSKVIEENDIIVYQVSEVEISENAAEKDLRLFNRLQTLCEEKQKYLIYFATKRIENGEITSFYASIANVPVTLLERIKALLYL